MTLSDKIDILDGGNLRVSDVEDFIIKVLKEFDLELTKELNPVIVLKIIKLLRKVIKKEAGGDLLK